MVFDSKHLKHKKALKPWKTLQVQSQALTAQHASSPRVLYILQLSGDGSPPHRGPPKLETPSSVSHGGLCSYYSSLRLQLVLMYYTDGKNLFTVCQHPSLA